MAFFTTEVEGWEPVTGDWDITGCWAVDFVEMTSSTLGGLSADGENIDNIVTSQIQLLYAPAVINETRNWITLGSKQICALDVLTKWTSSSKNPKPKPA